MEQPRIQYVSTSDNVKIAYWKVGDGLPMVITPYHAFSHIGMDWQNEVNRGIYLRLADQRSVVRYDGRGSGLSQRLVDPTLDAQVHDLSAVIEALGEARVVVVGMGLAGPGAVRFAAEHPEGVSHLVLYDTFLRYSDLRAQPGYSAIEAVSEALEDHTEFLGRTWAAMKGIAGDWFAAYVKASWTKEAAEAYRKLELDCTPWAESVKCPALVIHEQWPGEDSTLSRELAARLPAAQLAVIDRNVSDPWNDIGDFSGLVYDFLGLRVPSSATNASSSRVMTVLFTDIVSHTEMMQRLGDVKGRDVLREHERMTRETLKQHGGAEVKTMGDGFMASFGSVTQAVECAVALQRAFAEREGEPLSVRVGLNAGEPIEEDGDLFGATIILASRIAAKAGASEILIPEPVRHLLSGKSFVFSDRGEFVMKGFDDAVRLYEVRWRE